MIVDDDRDDHFFLKKALKVVIPAADVHSFYNGCELMDHLYTRSNQPSLIFLDLNMPKMDGRTTATLLKQDKLLSNIPLVIFTTSISLSDRLDLTNLGADDFYTKPVCSLELIKIVERVNNKWLK